jgi:hypothetical protein
VRDRTEGEGRRHPEFEEAIHFAGAVSIRFFRDGATGNSDTTVELVRFVRRTAKEQLGAILLP